MAAGLAGLLLGTAADVLWLGGNGWGTFGGAALGTAGGVLLARGGDDPPGRSGTGSDAGPPGGRPDAR